MDERKQRVIHFDLSTRKLKKVYPGADYHQAYKDIQKYLEEKGFEHHQWSGYVSQKKITSLEASECTNGLIMTYPWLRASAKKLNVSIVPKEDFDAIERFDSTLQSDPEFKKRFANAMHRVALERKERQKRRPMKEVFAEAQKAADEYNAKLGIRPISKDDLER